MSELISRQAAIDAVQHAFDRETLLNSFVRKVAVDALKTMPSAQPKVEPFSDAISRAEVLKYAQLVRDDEGIVHEMVHVDDIKGASSVTWSSWKLATEELPPSYEAVLLYVKYKSSGQWTYQLGMWNDNKQAWEDWRTPYRLEEEFDVIAWMELPEIYEEDNNEW